MTQPVTAAYEALLDYKQQLAKCEQVAAGAAIIAGQLDLPRPAAAFGWTPSSLAVQEAWATATGARQAEVARLRRTFQDLVVGIQRVVELYQLADEDAARRVAAHDG